tara:strand:+ start:385 stop:624 length:240 start_codon:yes stop_codon:yes gene_type:complete
MSEIEDKIIVKIKERAEKGAKKYGVTMERDDLTYTEWLIHLQEELMDACVYIEKLLTLKDETQVSDDQWQGYVRKRWYP